MPLSNSTAWSGIQASSSVGAKATHATQLGFDAQVLLRADHEADHELYIRAHA
jgi:hypothetical protein